MSSPNSVCLSPRIPRPPLRLTASGSPMRNRGGERAFPLRHDHEPDPVLVPASQPADPPTVQPIPQLQYLRKPQKLGADFHSSHLHDSFSAFAYALVWNHVHGLCTLRFLRPSKGTGSTLSAAGAGFRTVAWHDRSKAMRCLPMCT